MDLAQIIISEPEEMMKDSLHIKGIQLELFKTKSETLRVKFTQQQKKAGVLSKELVFELRNCLEGWLEGVEDYGRLKDLIITDQIKQRVSPEIKDNFLEEWGKLYTRQI